MLPSRTPVIPTGAERSPAQGRGLLLRAGEPTDPTVEVGYRSLAPAGTPGPIVDKVAGSIAAALRDARIREALAARDVEKREGGPDRTQACTAAELWKGDAIATQSAPPPGEGASVPAQQMRAFLDNIFC